MRFARIDNEAAIPPRDERTIDIALLDMNHRWPNMGHDAIAHAIAESARPLNDALAEHGVSFRVLSFDIRASLAVPEPAGERFLLYVGTGGPGHIDPAKNDGAEPASQGIAEDPSWEPRLFNVFDSIGRNEDAALLAICHTFGVMCRWSGIAQPALRDQRKGGKSSGLVQNVLTAAGLEHPWFNRFASELPQGFRFTVIDNRLFDLIPTGAESGANLIAFETRNGSGAPGEAVTMIELARDRGGVMPRIYGVNHHPEVVDRARALSVLRQMVQRGDVSKQWYEERATTLTEQIAGLDVEALLRLTSQFTLLFPLQFQLTRLLRLRLERLGIESSVDEHASIENLMGYARGQARS
jgi:hypothetical protein